MLEEKRLSALIGDCPIGSRLLCKEVTDSTNLDIRRAAFSGEKEGLVAVAEEQTDGKGRRGRSWSSPYGVNLYFSMLLKPCLPKEKAAMVTPLMALAVADAARKCGFDAKIKWPNDVVIGGKKICGILTEMDFLNDGSYCVIIGTGINVNQEQFPEEIRERATSLKLEGGAKIGREELLSGVLLGFAGYYGRFVSDGDLSGVKEAYEALLVNCNAPVEVLDPKGAWKGTALGIDDAGELLVRHESGSVEAVYSGEVSVRGIYGYV